MSWNFTAVREMSEISVKIKEMSRKNFVGGNCPKTFPKIASAGFLVLLTSYSMTVILCCLLLNFAYLCFSF